MTFQARIDSALKKSIDNSSRNVRKSTTNKIIKKITNSFTTHINQLETNLEGIRSNYSALEERFSLLQSKLQQLEQKHSDEQQDLNNAIDRKVNAFETALSETQSHLPIKHYQQLQKLISQQVADNLKRDSLLSSFAKRLDDQGDDQERDNRPTFRVRATYQESLTKDIVKQLQTQISQHPSDNQKRDSLLSLFAKRLDDQGDEQQRNSELTNQRLDTHQEALKVCSADIGSGTQDRFRIQAELIALNTKLSSQRDAQTDSNRRYSALTTTSLQRIELLDTAVLGCSKSNSKTLRDLQSLRDKLASLSETLVGRKDQLDTHTTSPTLRTSMIIASLEEIRDQQDSSNNRLHDYTHEVECLSSDFRKMWSAIKVLYSRSFSQYAAAYFAFSTLKSGRHFKEFFEKKIRKLKEERFCPPEYHKSFHSEPD